MKVGKTPYEIRLDLLRLAYDIITMQKVYERDNDEHAKIKGFTSDEVITEAKKLNAFVSEDTIRPRKDGQSH
jgi:hypothetical protein